jgi:WD40 repeat protein
LKLEDYHQQLLQDGALPAPKGQLEEQELSAHHKAAVDAVLKSSWAALKSDARSLLCIAGQLPKGTIIPTARLGLLAGLTEQKWGLSERLLTRALKELEENSLVEKAKDDQVWLHPLVHTFAAKQSVKAVHPSPERCVTNLVNAYEEIAILEGQAVERNVDALREDLVSGEKLLHKAPGDPKDLEKQLKDLRELLSDVPSIPQAQSEKATFFLKQIFARATNTGLDHLAGKISERLTQLGKHRFMKQWRTVREPRMLEHNLCGHSSITRAVAVTTDGCWAVSAADDSKLKVWDLIEGQEKRTLCGHESGVRAVAVTRDGHWAISASNDCTLKVWDLETGVCVRSLQGHTEWVLAVALTPDERRVVSASKDNTLKIWNLETWSEERTLQGHKGTVTAVAVTPDGSRAISASHDYTLKVWNMETGSLEHTLYSHNAVVSAVAVTQYGRCAVSASFDRKLGMWDLETGEMNYFLKGHKGRINGVAITPDGYWAVSASSDRTLKVWNLKDRKEMRTLRGHEKDVTAVAMTPDGHWAVSASLDHTLKVWDLHAARLPRSHNARVIAVATMPKSKQAISVSRDGVLKMWELQTGHELAQLELDVELQNITLSPNGKEILAGDKSGNIYCLRYNEPIPSAAP